jgi:glycyl-tRNA synthetase
MSEESSNNISVKAKDLTAYLKHYGFFFPNAEIYGGLAKSWDLGPYGIELKRNLKNLWWKYFITSSPYNIGCDSQIITHPRVLEASGHLKNFHDWLTECINCRGRYRLDKVLSEDKFNAFLAREKNFAELFPDQRIEVVKTEYTLKEEKCPNCQQRTLVPPRQFNLLLTTNLEITDGKENMVYLRPETCQGIFTNFPSIQRSARRQLPFGVGQIGKSFRNEITLHQGIFRTREFEQLELEFFFRSEESEKWWNYWTEKAWSFLQKVIVNDQSRIKQVELTKEELPHYAKKTQDLYFQYHFGWGELCSNSHRGNYDLSQHSQHSKKTGNKFWKSFWVNDTIPEVVESSFGVERLMLAILEDAYQKEEIIVKGEKREREVLKLSPLLAPYFVAVIPSESSLREKSYQLYCELMKNHLFSVAYEETGNIGNRYRRQDAIGTYYCLTVDALTISEHLPDGQPNPHYNTVTLRHRNSMKKEKDRISMAVLKDLKIYLNSLYETHWQEFTAK